MKSDGGSTIYRCSSSHRDDGEAWFDFALVEDPKSSRSYIGRIMGMFEFKTRGFPTPKLADLDNLPVDDIKERNMSDPTRYIVVRASSRCFTEKVLSKKMITPFKLTDSDAMYILPATAIKMPLLVVRDFGAESKRNYLHCLPRTKWPGLFTLKIKELMEQGRRRGKKRSRSLDNEDSEGGDDNLYGDDNDESDDEYDSDDDTLEQMKAKSL